ncbi:AraC family transcriptional regulator [Marinobacterium aestuariivivens]|uniref:Helix-turn-helix domain-containing protein n=1 Tax=Marinobacterium aestuariivivens TaxID=1698799 RepID=A0ABW1ZYE2_9GAMM
MSMVKTADILTLPDSAHTHDHNYHQLVLGLEGDTAFELEGLGQRVGPGTGCLVPSSTAHAFCGIGRNSILVVNLAMKPAGNREERERINRLFDQASYFDMSSHLQVLASAVSREIRQFPDDPMLAQACSNMLLCTLGNHLSLKQPCRKPGMIDLELIDDFIRVNLQRKISVAHLASLACLSSSQFHELFKRQTGMTPHQHLLEKRLSAAHDLLEQGHPVARVIELCGFANQSAFTHAFRRRFGITPARYRQQAALTCD